MYRIRVYIIKINLVLFKLDSYKFKILIVIPKVTSKKITKKYMKKEKRGESIWHSMQIQLNAERQ